MGLSSTLPLMSHMAISMAESAKRAGPPRIMFWQRRRTSSATASMSVGSCPMTSGPTASVMAGMVTGTVAKLNASPQPVTPSSVSTLTNNASTVSPLWPSDISRLGPPSV